MYEPRYGRNTIRWRPGDLVIHDADAKRVDMVMVVIGYDRKGLCKTRYISDEKNKKVWENDIMYLHPLSQFGIRLYGAWVEEK